jgi:hypothetical protein
METSENRVRSALRIREWGFQNKGENTISSSIDTIDGLLNSFAVT